MKMIFVTFGLLVACSGGSFDQSGVFIPPLVSDSGSVEPDVNVPDRKDDPETCVVKSRIEACGTKECGSAWDGCSGTINCGDCASPQVCGGGGSPGFCGCTPVSRNVACGSRNCSVVSDGCSGTHDCGSCILPQTCGGDPLSTPGVCGCTPKSISAACGSKECGRMPDGCGGLVSCGICSGDEVCGSVTPDMCDLCPQDNSFTVCPSNIPVPRKCPNTSYNLPNCSQSTAAGQPTPVGQYCCAY